jgi:AcrR family transcriptional regulator
MSKKSIKPRKKPVQERSKAKVEQILRAVLQLLSESGLEGVTAIKIAEKGQLSVASIYQYFPNIKAVIVFLYEKWLKELLLTYDRIEKKYYLKIPMEDFFIRLGDAFLTKTIFDPRAEAELFRASDVYPVLRAIDHEHSGIIAQRIAGYLKGYGSYWDKKTLKTFSLFIYQIMCTLQRNYVEEKYGASRQFKQWGEFMLLNLIKECFNGNKLKTKLPSSINPII